MEDLQADLAEAMAERGDLIREECASRDAMKERKVANLQRVLAAEKAIADAQPEPDAPAQSVEG